MFNSLTRRLAVTVIAVAGLGACATSHHAWDVRDRGSVRAPEAPNSLHCPVVVTNQTGHILDAGYVVGGVRSMLGVIPDGRSLTLGVSCDGGAIEAFARSTTSPSMSGERYQTAADIAAAGATRLRFTVLDRVR